MVGVSVVVALIARQSLGYIVVLLVQFLPTATFS